MIILYLSLISSNTIAASRRRMMGSLSFWRISVIAKPQGSLLRSLRLYNARNRSNMEDFLSVAISCKFWLYWVQSLKLIIGTKISIHTAVLSEAWAKLCDWASVVGRGRLLLSGSVAHASLKTAVQIVRCLLWKQITTLSLRNINPMFHSNLWSSSFTRPSTQIVISSFLAVGGNVITFSARRLEEKHELNKS